MDAFREGAKSAKVAKSAKSEAHVDALHHTQTNAIGFGFALRVEARDVNDASRSSVVASGDPTLIANPKILLSPLGDLGDLGAFSSESP